MVKLTEALVIRKMKKKSCQRTDTDKDVLRKLTHLHLQDNFIDTIVSTKHYCFLLHSKCCCILTIYLQMLSFFFQGDISHCKNLTVLYLQNNCLTEIDNLEHACQLTHLYLQRNKISKIKNLNGLRKLKKL